LFLKINGVWLAIVVAECMAVLLTALCLVWKKKKYHY